MPNILLKRLYVVVVLLLLSNVAYSQSEAAEPKAPDAGEGDSGVEVEQDVEKGEDKKPEFRFDIWELRVEGNTLLDSKLIEQTLYPHLGPNKTLSDLDEARLALEMFYKNAGFQTVLVDIPEQKVNLGVVRLQVTEGTLSRFRVSNSRYFSIRRIKSQVPALEKGEPLNIPAFQDQLADLNSATTDRVVTPIFRPGKTPGTVEVELRVKDKFPLHGEFEINNFQTKDTSELRVATTVEYGNLWQREHSASLMYMSSPIDPADVKVFSGTYIAPMGDDVLAAYYVNSDSDVASAGDITVLGAGSIFGLRYIIPRVGLDRSSYSVTLGFDYKDFDESVDVFGEDAADTPIKYINWSAGLRGSLYQGRARVSYGLSANFGIKGLVNEESEFDNKRLGAVPNYFYVGADAEYRYPFEAAGMFVSKLELQLSDSPLISNEQYSAGGASSVRGYFESQQQGDNGALLNLEYYTPSFHPESGYLTEAKVVAFLDGAYLQVRSALPGQDVRSQLFGAGLGVRLKSGEAFNLVCDVASALKDAEDVEKGDIKAHASIVYSF